MENEAANSTSKLINRTDAESIDGCEQALLELAYPAMRKAMSAQIERQSQEIFAAQDFDKVGQPIEKPEVKELEHLPLKELEVAKKEMIENAPEDLRQLLEKQVLIESEYETKNTCYASVDDVCYKRQKKYRKEHTAEKGTKAPLKRVYNSVIRVQLAGQLMQLLPGKYQLSLYAGVERKLISRYDVNRY